MNFKATPKCTLGLIERREIKMIKNVQLKPLDIEKPCELPTYVYGNGVEKYTLFATVQGDYKITLAKLTIGSSVSAGNDISHAMFESYSDHGEKMSEAKIRMGGLEREFMAVKNAMSKAGIEFENIAPCHFCDLLNALGAYYQAGNPEITEYAVVSQRCH